jgi:predicted dehydrogenase
MKPIKLGVLGVSTHYGLRVSIPAAQSPMVELRALGSRSLERSKKAAAEWGFEKAYGSYEEVLSDPEVEAVYIPLPNDLHATWIKKCADAGKAVLCEKPVALDSAEAADAFSYAESKGVLAMEAFMYRFHPQWVRAKELIDIGEIGDVMSIHTIFSFSNTDLENIRNIKANGGGALYDIGCYAISSARFLMGGEPERVVADIVTDQQTQTDTLSSAMMDFGGGRRAQFTVSTRMAPRQKVSVYGSGGSLTVVLPFNAYPDVPLVVVVNNGVGTREIKCGPADQYGLMLEAFAKSFREGSSAPTPPSDAIANMKVIDAVFRSGSSGKWETV